MTSAVVAGKNVFFGKKKKKEEAMSFKSASSSDRVSVRVLEDKKIKMKRRKNSIGAFSQRVLDLSLACPYTLLMPAVSDYIGIGARPKL